LQTTETPTNWGFMSFICTMVGDFNESIGKDRMSSIPNHDDFTKFIQEKVKA